VALRRLDLSGVAAADVAGLLPRPAIEETLPTETVRAIVDEVRRDGDAALRRLTARFDGVDLDVLEVSGAEARAALDRIPAELRSALELAWDRILAYHAHEPAPVGDFESDGVRVRHLTRPVARAGIYAPGGRARYPSTVLMCAAPARVAGVVGDDALVLTVPPGPDGRVADETLAAAAVAGIERIFPVGGAQAIAALAYGTETVPAVDVVVGPGNRYVAEAKRQLAGVVGVPAGFAGPSEVVVIADESTPVDWAAVDVVVQAEHGPDGLAWLVTWSASFADAVTEAVDGLVARSPRRADLEETLGRGGYAVVVDGPDEAAAVANAVAPEHLEIQTADPESLLPLVRRAAAVFVGPYAPASVGDYVAGPNHVLPTARSARFASALRSDDFRTHIHVVDLDAPALARLAPAVTALAEAEGLPAHAASVRMRTEAASTGAAPTGTASTEATP
jgi:histidinol dehydrogenase